MGGENREAGKTWLKNLELVVRIVVILWTTGWTTYVFFYQERIKPAPLHPSLELKVVGGDEEHALVEATLQVANTGARRVNLLPSGFVATAFGLEISQQENPEFDKLVKAELESRDDGGLVTKWDSRSSPEVVAVQKLFRSWALDSGEIVEHKFLFGVPAKGYEVLHATVKIPRVVGQTGLEVRWELVDGNVKPTYFETDKAGRRRALKRGDPADDEVFEDAKFEALYRIDGDPASGEYIAANLGQ